MVASCVWYIMMCVVHYIVMYVVHHIVVYVVHYIVVRVVHYIVVRGALYCSVHRALYCGVSCALYCNVCCALCVVMYFICCDVLHMLWCILYIVIYLVHCILSILGCRDSWYIEPIESCGMCGWLISVAALTSSSLRRFHHITHSCIHMSARHLVPYVLPRTSGVVHVCWWHYTRTILCVMHGWEPHVHQFHVIYGGIMCDIYVIHRSYVFTHCLSFYSFSTNLHTYTSPAINIKSI